MKKTVIVSLVLALCLTLGSVASACTAIYVGSSLTTDGSAFACRSEDYYVNDFNKIMYVAPAGNHKAGEVYDGCYGFSWTYTHDSYAYTARRDDNTSGECPDCGGTHEHTPYEEAGTNEHGVSVSATETLYANDAVQAVDPYIDEGIEEAEITTVILGEAATAREGVELLLSIYDKYGACGGSGIFIVDKDEQWFIENMSGHSYIAVKCSPELVFIQPNISTIGLIDLDDTENVIASANLITVAQEAGTYVGSADDNTINHFASYFADVVATENGDYTYATDMSVHKNWSRWTRMQAGLNYLYGTDIFTCDNMVSSDWVMTNVGEGGEIVPLYSHIKLFETADVDTIVNFYKQYPIGYTENEDIHLFQLNANAADRMTTVEWGTLDDGRYNVFTPVYPMLVTGFGDMFMVSIGDAAVSETAPESGDWYFDGESYVIYPEGWQNSYFWTVNALSNLIEFGSVSDEDKAAITAALADAQNANYATYAEMEAAVTAAADEDKAAVATGYANRMYASAHDVMLALYNQYK